MATKDSDAQATPRYKRLWAAFAAVVMPVGVFFMGLGSFSDATLLIRDLSVEVYGLFSYQHDYDTINSIHIGNTVPYIEDLLGSPQVSRGIDDKTTANYFFTDSYLLTLFYREQRIAAYTVVAIDDGFTPTLNMLAGEKILGEFTPGDIPIPPKSYAVDDSRIVSFYLESVDSGRAGNFVDLYLGRVAYGVGGPAESIAKLYRAGVNGTDTDIEQALGNLRGKLIPNLYGRGTIDIEGIQDSVLTANQFEGYTASD
jgi:hypothetical protein